MASISTSYDAWWFLYEHPKLMVKERIERSEKPTPEDLPGTEWKVWQDAGGNWWAEQLSEYAPQRRAIECNLDIHYAKVDETGHVNDDSSKNVNIECWLEFGHIEWGYATDWEPKEGGREHVIMCHDIRLDCGGKTFDEALIRLAGLVLEHFGDYKAWNRPKD